MDRLVVESGSRSQAQREAPHQAQNNVRANVLKAGPGTGKTARAWFREPLRDVMHHPKAESRDGVWASLPPSAILAAHTALSSATLHVSNELQTAPLHALGWFPASAPHSLTPLSVSIPKSPVRRELNGKKDRDGKRSEVLYVPLVLVQIPNPCCQSITEPLFPARALFFSGDFILSPAYLGFNQDSALPQPHPNFGSGSPEGGPGPL